MKLYKTVSPFGNIKDDLFYWIKFYISQKLFDIKQDDGYNVDVIEASQKLFQSKTIDIFNKEQLKIVKNGFSYINVYVNPLLNLYDYVSSEKSLKQITDFNTEYRDKLFLRKIKDFRYSTKVVHFIQVNGLFTFIENSLSNIKGAETYKFNLKKTIVNNKLVYPFSKDTVSKRVIQEDEIVLLLSMMNSFFYRGMSVSKATFMLKLVLFSGITNAELSNLKYDDLRMIDKPSYLLREKYLEIQVTHSIPRKVYINKKLIIDEYTQYQVEYNASSLCFNNEYYFYTQEGKKYTSNSIYHHFKKLIEHANIKIENSVNTFLKYGYASYLYKNDVSLDIILTLFGNKVEIRNYFENVHIK